jgi:hypothetical protein
MVIMSRIEAIVPIVPLAPSLVVKLEGSGQWHRAVMNRVITNENGREAASTYLE